MTVETRASIRAQFRAALIRLCLATPLAASAGRALLLFPSRAMGLFSLPGFSGWVCNDVREAWVV